MVDNFYHFHSTSHLICQPQPYQSKIQCMYNVIIVIKSKIDMFIQPLSIPCFFNILEAKCVTITGNFHFVTMQFIIIIIIKSRF